MDDVTKYDDVIDSRDVVDLAEDIWELRMDPVPPPLTDADRAILALDIEGRDIWGREWGWGVTLVRYDYFEEYARELAEDLGLTPDHVNGGYTWPTSCIDWTQAAEDLRHDYTEIEFDGISYYGRA